MCSALDVGLPVCQHVSSGHGLATTKHCRPTAARVGTQTNLLYMFEPVAVENLDALSSSTLDFLLEMGRRIYHQFGDVRESSYLFQRISVSVGNP